MTSKWGNNNRYEAVFCKIYPGKQIKIKSFESSCESGKCIGCDKMTYVFKQKAQQSHWKIFHQRGVEMIDRTYNKRLSQNFCLNRKLSIETLSEKFNYFLV